MQIPIGHSDYAEIKTHKGIGGEQFCLVDKTCFITDVIKDPNKVIVITRPRRFGKTLNLSMLYYFFNYQYNLDNPANTLFKNTKISNNVDAMRFKGANPTILLMLGDVKALNFKSMLDYLGVAINGIYRDHLDLLMGSDKLKSSDKAYIDKVLAYDLTEAQLADSLKNLTRMLHQATGRKVIICLDEYDTPIQYGFLHMYYDECMSFIRAFFTSAFKNNSYLEKAVLTGINRISKESLFSGMNNAKVYTILDDRYAEYFGFTIDEVEDLYKKVGINTDISNIKSWYNGYNFGGYTIYNPWSIVNCADNNSLFKAYWVNTADNSIIKSLIMQSEYEIKQSVEKLIAGESIELIISEHFTYVDENSSVDQILNLLLTAGYLTAQSINLHRARITAKVKIPNFEAKHIFLNVIKTWYREKTFELA